MPHSDPDAQTRYLLVLVCAALLAGGMPVNEAEDEVRDVAARLGYPAVQVSASPTGVVLSLGAGGAATFEEIRGPLRLDQTAEANAIAAGLREGTLGPDAALQRLLTLRRKPHLYHRFGFQGGHLMAAVGIALVLQPTWPSAVFAALSSPFVSTAVRVSGRWRLLTTLLPCVAAFAVASAAFGADSLQLLDRPLRTMLAPLAMLFPGALLVTGLTELAAGAMIAGTARLAYGSAQLLLLAIGVGSAAVLLRVPPEALQNVRVAELGPWAGPVGILLVTAGMSLMESVRPGLVPWVLAVILGTYGAQSLGGVVAPAAWVGAFLGATTASLGATVVEWLRPSLPRLVVFLPSFWLLVPGSLGLVSVTQLGLEPELAGASIAESTSVVCAIAIGVVVGASIARSVRLAVRALRFSTRGSARG